MKIAVVYNRESKSVINLFGLPNREKYGLKSIKRITDALRKNGHQVIALEGDKDLIRRLEEFMPRVVKGELPGMVFNLSYGIQGQARYTHVPGMLEMIGIPYVGSGPLAHSLALDKVVAKMIFRQRGLPTPDFAVLDNPDFDTPDLDYPLIVKPKNEAVSMGIRIVENEDQLREAAQKIFDMFEQPVLAENYIEGREINVGLIGNNPTVPLPPCEIVFGEGGPAIYTIEDKKGKSGRTIDWLCPAPISEELAARAQEISVGAFSALGCYDCARVDLRLDSEGNFYILEINSLPSLGVHGSYTIAAKEAGLDFDALVNRLVDVAGTRYFGTPSLPSPEVISKNRDVPTNIFSYITHGRDRIERRVEDWVSLSSRTSDPMGLRAALTKFDQVMTEIKMKPVEEYASEKSISVWQTKPGLDEGILLVTHLDVPLEPGMSRQMFRREPEFLIGEGIGASRAPLVMLEFVLKALRSQKRLHRLPLGVLVYQDEGADCMFSESAIRSVLSKVKKMLVLRPGNLEDKAITQRRGQRKYVLAVEGKSRRLGQKLRGADVLAWTFERLTRITKLTDKHPRTAVAATDLDAESYPMRLPHRVTAKLTLTYLDQKTADNLIDEVQGILGKRGYRWDLRQVSERPPQKDRRNNQRLYKDLADVAEQWEIPISHESSLWPSVAGLAPARVQAVCGLGPAAKDMYTPQEAVSRVSLIQRTLLLAEFLLTQERK